MLWLMLPFKTSNEVSKEAVIKDRIGKALDQPSPLDSFIDNQRRLNRLLTLEASTYNPNYGEPITPEDLNDILFVADSPKGKMMRRRLVREGFVESAIKMARTFSPETKGMSDEEVQEFMNKTYPSDSFPSKDDLVEMSKRRIPPYPLFNPYGDILNFTGSVKECLTPEDFHTHYPLTPDDMVSPLSMDLIEEISPEGFHTFYKGSFQTPNYWYRTMAADHFWKEKGRQNLLLSPDCGLMEYGFLRVMNGGYYQFSYKAGLDALGDYFSTKDDDILVKSYWRTPDPELNEIFKNHFKL